MPKDSMWKASKTKKAANKEHSRNFEAGRVKVKERTLHRTGLRGRKILIYGLVLLVLFIVTLGNLVITAYILGSMYFTAGGPAAITYSGSSIVFPQRTTADRVQASGSVASQTTASLAVAAASDQSILLEGGNFRNTPFGGTPLPPSQVLANGVDGLSFQPYSSLSIANSSGDVGLHISKARMVSNGPERVAGLSVDSTIETQQVNLQSGSEPSLSSSGEVVFSGGSTVNASFAGSVRMEANSGDVLLSATSSIQNPLITRQSTVELRGGGGVVWPVPAAAAGSSGAPAAYAVCVCGHGLLFRVPSNTTSNTAAACTSHGQVVCLQT